MTLLEIPIVKVQLENDSFDFLPTFLTILVALIAAFIALYQVKSNNISNARIAWMENLREVLSELCVAFSDSRLTFINMGERIKQARKISPEAADNVLEENYDKFIQSLHKVNKLSNKVFLYLDSDNKTHQELEMIINKLGSDLDYEKIEKIEQEQLNKDLDKIIEISKKIFKTEWQKSKQIFKI